MRVAHGQMRTRALGIGLLEHHRQLGAGLRDARLVDALHDVRGRLLE